MPKQKASVSTTVAPGIPKYPAWYTLPMRPITWIEADHRVETDIDPSTGVGRVRVKPGYDVNINEIRYGSD